jgi:SAM-dependent methyltransferase
MNYIFPEEFNIFIYREENTHLSYMTDEELINHYKNFGYQEGLICNQIKNRNDFLNLIVNNKPQFSVEIGPLCCSLLKNIGIKNVKFIDYFSTEELKENYKDHNNINTKLILNVDYVVRDVKIYSDIINERFDVCFSSHNIEHTPCMITFLNNVSSILKNNGLFFLAIPDYRYCFDRYKNPSTIFDVLYKYYTNAQIPCALSILDNRFNGTINDTQVHWENSYKALQTLGYYDYINKKNDFLDLKKNDIIDNIDYIKDIILNNKEYIDSHCWKYSPESFCYIIDILIKTKLINFELIKCYKTLKGSNEFYIILKNISLN